MIEIDDDGTARVCFEDWTPWMMALSSTLYELPRRPGSTGPSTHEYGVDRLARMRNGARAAELLWDCMDDLEHRPEEDEVIRMGRRLLAMDRS